MPSARQWIIFHKAGRFIFRKLEGIAIVHRHAHTFWHTQNHSEAGLHHSTSITICPASLCRTKAGLRVRIFLHPFLRRKRKHKSIISNLVITTTDNQNTFLFHFPVFLIWRRESTWWTSVADERRWADELISPLFLCFWRPPFQLVNYVLKDITCIEQMSNTK